MRTIGETYQSTTLHAGLAEAERHGIPGDRLAAGLARLLGTTGGAA